jgi:hypothetical protein
VVVGESFRLSRQTDGLFLAGPETIEKNKSEIRPATGKPTYRPPGTP